MGSDGHYPEEAPAHKVTVAGFWISRYTVTNADFNRFVDATGYVTLAEHPAIDLSLFRIPTFHTGVLVGSLFRVGVGATPFLLPLLLQLGFGMDPLQSGLLTCATAVGAMFMKTLTSAILRRFGFRAVLTANALVSSAAVATFGLFTAATPHLVIFLVLLVSGCLRSLQFTSLQAISFAEVTRETMSQASSIASMAQRLSQSLGVAIGAGGWIVQRVIGEADRRWTRKVETPLKQLGVTLFEGFARIWLLAGFILIAALVGGRRDGLTTSLVILGAYSVAFAVKVLSGPPPRTAVR